MRAGAAAAAAAAAAISCSAEPPSRSTPAALFSVQEAATPLSRRCRRVRCAAARSSEGSEDCAGGGGAVDGRPGPDLRGEGV